MKIFFDLEYYKTNYKYEIVRISAIKYYNGKEDIFDKKLSKQNIESNKFITSLENYTYTSNLINLDFYKIDEVDNIVEDFKSFINKDKLESNSIEMIHYGTESNSINQLEQELNLNDSITWIDFKEIVKEKIGTNKTNQMFISNLLEIEFPFYQEHNSIFEVENMVEINKKLELLDPKEILSIQTKEEELLKKHNILWNYHKCPIQEDYFNLNSNSNESKFLIVSGYNEGNNIIVINNENINYGNEEVVKSNGLENIEGKYFKYGRINHLNGIKKLLKVTNSNYCWVLKEKN